MSQLPEAARALSQESTAVPAFPRWSGPEGEGAKRPRVVKARGSGAAGRLPHKDACPSGARLIWPGAPGPQGPPSRGAGEPCPPARLASSSPSFRSAPPPTGAWARSPIWPRSPAGPTMPALSRAAPAGQRGRPGPEQPLLLPLGLRHRPGLRGPGGAPRLPARRRRGRAHRGGAGAAFFGPSLAQGPLERGPGPQATRLRAGLRAVPQGRVGTAERPRKGARPLRRFGSGAGSPTMRSSSPSTTGSFRARPGPTGRNRSASASPRPWPLPGSATPRRCCSSSGCSGWPRSSGALPGRPPTGRG